jgi:hypothetical protein
VRQIFESAIFCLTFGFSTPVIGLKADSKGGKSPGPFPNTYSSKFGGAKFRSDYGLTDCPNKLITLQVGQNYRF